MTQSAILTGDFRASRAMSAEMLDQAMAILAHEAALVETWPNLSPLCFTRSRGDGWQIRIAPAALGFRVGLRLWTRLRRDMPFVTSRIAMGFGQAVLPSDDLSIGSGTAFLRSGDALDQMRGKENFAASGEALGPLHFAVLDLCAALMGELSPEGAAAVYEMLPPLRSTQREAALRAGASPQAFGQRLMVAKWAALNTALTAWESAL